MLAAPKTIIWAKVLPVSFALALDEACFACEGVGVVLEDLLERVFDLRCEMGDVLHSALSVPSVWAALKLMPMGQALCLPRLSGAPFGEQGVV